MGNMGGDRRCDTREEESMRERGERREESEEKGERRNHTSAMVAEVMPEPPQRPGML